MGNDRSLLMQLSRELRDSVHAGAALAALTLAAGCNGKDTTFTTDVPTGDHSTPAITTTTTTPDPRDAATTTPDPRDAATVDLLPHDAYPLAQLGCYGPGYDGGFYGQCCYTARCYTPQAGAACISATDDAALRTKIELPWGSGECSCAVPAEGHPETVTGPFASNPADHSEGDAGRSGSCCYVVGSISCTGRPFCVDGTQLVAQAVARVDWLLG